MQTEVVFEAYVDNKQRIKSAMKLFHKLVSFVTVLVAFALPTVVQGGGDSDCKSIGM